MARLKDHYRDTIAPSMLETFSYGNAMRIPKVDKVVINTSISTMQERDKNLLNEIAEGIAMIAGQRPVLTRAKTSVSNFRLREDMPIGAKVTLRGVRMYEFLDRLINIALPRIRDFRGVSPKSFDGRGNYNLGIEDQTIFPEINPDKIPLTHGMDIAIVTTAVNNEEAHELLKQFGMPFAAPATS